MAGYDSLTPVLSVGRTAGIAKQEDSKKQEKRCPNHYSGAVTGIPAIPTWQTLEQATFITGYDSLTLMLSVGRTAGTAEKENSQKTKNRCANHTGDTSIGVSAIPTW